MQYIIILSMKKAPRTSLDSECGASSNSHEEVRVMTTVPQTTTETKPPKAFYCHLDDEAGTLAKVDEVVYFYNPDSGAITVVTSYKGLVVLGEVGLADTQRLMDDLHDGLAAVATSRAN